MAERIIWKFDVRVDDTVIVHMPEGAEVIHWDIQREDVYAQIQCWAIVDPLAAFKPRTFYIRGTGHPMREADSARHVATLLVSGGNLVWHIFEPVTERQP